jgi:hypothetical protein
MMRWLSKPAAACGGLTIRAGAPIGRLHRPGLAAAALDPLALSSE